MKFLSLRWVFLLAALAGAVLCAFAGTTLPRAGATAACGLLWYLLSRRKMHSLDRETLGVPPRA